MKIAVLYICTGRYSDFWPSFFASAQRFLCAPIEKHYFVFSDKSDFLRLPLECVKFNRIPNEPWPRGTLLRFHYFAPISSELERYDLVIFCNSNMVFVQAIEAEELMPNLADEEGIFVTLHPGYVNRSRESFPYENTQPESAAYLPPGSGDVYVCGGFNGGSGPAYSKMILTLRDRIEADLTRGTVARWHDESHLNHFVSARRPKLLDSRYVWPETWLRITRPKALVLDKRLRGGHDFFRGLRATPARAKLMFLLRARLSAVWSWFCFSR